MKRPNRKVGAAYIFIPRKTVHLQKYPEIRGEYVWLSQGALPAMLDTDTMVTYSSSSDSWARD